MALGIISCACIPLLVCLLCDSAAGGTSTHIFHLPDIHTHSSFNRLTKSLASNNSSLTKDPPPTPPNLLPRLLGHLSRLNRQRFCRLQLVQIVGHGPESIVRRSCTEQRCRQPSTQELVCLRCFVLGRLGCFFLYHGEFLLVMMTCDWRRASDTMPWRGDAEQCIYATIHSKRFNQISPTAYAMDSRTRVRACTF